MTQSYGLQQPYHTGTLFIPDLGACELVPRIFPLLKIFLDFFEAIFRTSLPETQENQPSKFMVMPQSKCNWC